jgi:hypothetical protein
MVFLRAGDIAHGVIDLWLAGLVHHDFKCRTPHFGIRGKYALPLRVLDALTGPPLEAKSPMS